MIYFNEYKNNYFKFFKLKYLQSPIWNNPARWCTLIHGKVKPLSKLALAIVAKPCTRTASEYKCLLCSKSRMSPFYILRHMERHLGQLKKGNRDGSFR